MCIRDRYGTVAMCVLYSPTVSRVKWSESDLRHCQRIGYVSKLIVSVRIYYKTYNAYKPAFLKRMGRDPLLSPEEAFGGSRNGVQKFIYCILKTTLHLVLSGIKYV